MSLILAIEPNKNQAHQLNALVRQHLKAELVTAPTAAAALAALGDRIPDVVLTPALFGLRDEAALTDRLRHWAPTAHTCRRWRSRSWRRAPRVGREQHACSVARGSKGDENVGCDPAVFAEQIRIYLQRASVERRAQASEAAARARRQRRPRPTAGESTADDLSAFMVSADELDVDSLELAVDSASRSDRAGAGANRPHTARSVTLDGVAGRWAPTSRTATSTIEEELGLVTPPPAGPPLWRVTESDGGLLREREAAAVAAQHVEGPLPAEVRHGRRRAPRTQRRRSLTTGPISIRHRARSRR